MKQPEPVELEEPTPESHVPTPSVLVENTPEANNPTENTPDQDTAEQKEQKLSRSLVQAALSCQQCSFTTVSRARPNTDQDVMEVKGQLCHVHKNNAKGEKMTTLQLPPRRVSDHNTTNSKQNFSEQCNWWSILQVYSVLYSTRYT